jgi:hypothetical protein
MIQEERTLIVVDLENACGGSGLVSANHRRVLKSINLLPTVRRPMVVFSTGPRAVAETPDLFWVWQSARFVQGRGLDGADNALISVLREEPVAARSSRIILVSGDHAFAEPLGEIRARGIRTGVMAHPASLSRKLAANADEILWVPGFDGPPTTPAGNYPVNFKEVA